MIIRNRNETKPSPGGETGRPLLLSRPPCVKMFTVRKSCTKPRKWGVAKASKASQIPFPIRSRRLKTIQLCTDALHAPQFLHLAWLALIPLALVVSQAREASAGLHAAVFSNRSPASIRSPRGCVASKSGFRSF